MTTLLADQPDCGVRFWLQIQGIPYLFADGAILDAPTADAAVHASRTAGHLDGRYARLTEGHVRALWRVTHQAAAGVARRNR